MREYWFYESGGYRFVWKRGAPIIGASRLDAQGYSTGITGTITSAALVKATDEKAKSLCDLWLQQNADPKRTSDLTVVEHTATDMNNLTCDFCGVEHQPKAEVTTYRVKPHTWETEVSEDYPLAALMGVGSVTHNDVDGLWAACKGCSPLIEAGQRDKLVERSFWIAKEKYPLPNEFEAKVKGEIKQIQDGFWKAKEEYEREHQGQCKSFVDFYGEQA